MARSLSQQASGAATNLTLLLELKAAATSQRPVSLGGRRTDSPHEFYRYPARFSPEFAQAAIRAFTDQDSFVLDPFVGGGTALVEAMRLRRNAIGSDINELAVFVSKVKTTVLGPDDIQNLKAWIHGLREHLVLRKTIARLGAWRAEGYLKALDSPSTWRLRTLIAQTIDSAESLATDIQRDFARCVILRTGQWALDMRDELPTVAEFREQLIGNALAMVRAAEEFASEVDNPLEPRILCQRLPGLADRVELRDVAADLILTSPPYPGVYVIYHRWKLRGRCEIPAPYWIANCNDGLGMASYTMNARSAQTLDSYFKQLADAFADIRRLCKPTAHVVQIVGFSNVSEQLPRYLKVMSDCGFQEVKIPQIATADDGRLWRQVPGRRWWTTSQSLKGVAPHTAKEAVLFHRPAPV